MLEHADVRTTRIASGNGSNDGADGTKHNARSLPEHGGGLATVNRNPEHEPVRQHVWSGILLAEDMSPLKMNERLVVLFSAHESSGQRDLFLESVALDWVHGSSFSEEVYPFARTPAWSPFLVARTILVLCEAQPLVRPDRETSTSWRHKRSCRRTGTSSCRRTGRRRCNAPSFRLRTHTTPSRTDTASGSRSSFGFSCFQRAVLRTF